MVRCIVALLAVVPLAASEDGAVEQIRRFVSVYAAVEREAADPVSPEKAFYEGAIPGMMRRLDPHSVFFDPDQLQQLKELQQSTRKGFGNVVSVLPGRVVVLQALPGTPSAKAGIAPGDEIVAINGYRLDRLDTEQLMGLMSHARQSEVLLEIRRAGESRILDFTMVPEEMQSPSVERAFFLRPGVGYIRVTSFDNKTGAQLKEAVEKLGGGTLRGLVLDLRDNPGGMLIAALESAALFLKPGLPLVTMRGRAVETTQEKVPESAKPYTFLMAVLINDRSASSSEIVAGCLQDHDRAAIVGEPSFGKGLVETVYPLSEDTGIALTTALYYTPSGRSIQKPLSSGQLNFTAESGDTETGTEYRTASGRPVRGGGGIEPDAVVYRQPMTGLRFALEASGSFTTFATQYTRAHSDISTDFDVTAMLMDDFQVFASQRNIRPGISEWSREREWIRSRLKAEIFNQALGVDKGDEVEAQWDPQIRVALEILGLG